MNASLLPLVRLAGSKSRTRRIRSCGYSAPSECVAAVAGAPVRFLTTSGCLCPSVCARVVHRALLAAFWTTHLGAATRRRRRIRARSGRRPDELSPNVILGRVHACAAPRSAYHYLPAHIVQSHARDTCCFGPPSRTLCVCVASVTSVGAAWCVCGGVWGAHSRLESALRSEPYPHSAVVLPRVNTTPCARVTSHAVRAGTSIAP